MALLEKIKAKEKAFFKLVHKKIKAEINRFLDRRLKPESLAVQEFPEVNVRIAENQKEYITLPAYHRGKDTSPDPHGRVVTYWGFSWKDRIRILFGKGLWAEQLTFGRSLQPILFSTDRSYHIPSPKKVTRSKHPDEANTY